MPLYRLLIHGSDFRISVGGEVQASDFFATRWLTAADEEAVESEVIEAISEELQELVEAGGDPELFVEEIDEVEEVPGGIEPGFSWFEHDNEEAGYDALDGERDAFWT